MPTTDTLLMKQPRAERSRPTSSPLTVDANCCNADHHTTCQHTTGTTPAVNAHAAETLKVDQTVNDALTLPQHAELNAAIQRLHAVVPPLWPLADYVAVNPFLGMVDQPFLVAREQLRQVRDCELLPSRAYFQQLLSTGRLKEADLHAALEDCRAEQPHWFANFDAATLTAYCHASATTGTDGIGSVSSAAQRFQTVAAVLDATTGTAWSTPIVNDLSRHCSAYYDEGQASWTHPWKGQGLFRAWRAAASISPRMDWLGLKGFREFVATLPDHPKAALAALVAQLGVPPQFIADYLLCAVFSVAGWASYVRYVVREAENKGAVNEDLIGLAAMRLAYDVTLAKKVGSTPINGLWPTAAIGVSAETSPIPDPDALCRFVLQTALERKYRHQLRTALTQPATKSAAAASNTSQATRKSLQIVFCIDVRSEVYRRHLESADAAIETFGFAGFFGLPLAYVRLGDEHGTPQCPVLLQPGFSAHEEVRGLSTTAQQQVVRQRRTVREALTQWKSFQGSVASCFTFVESLGWKFLGDLFAETFSGGKSRKPSAAAGPATADEQWVVTCGLQGAARVDAAANMLRNLGLTAGFARVVILCGHAAQVRNNPYRAALDCGACGGHSGEPNARAAAELLNDPAVRTGLAARGINIPADTCFLAAVHHTTTDEVVLCDAASIPASHQSDVEQINDWFRQAGQLTQQERSSRLGTADPTSILRRSHDWAEIRPEWGLANNAALIVAPRARTTGVNLGGRTFLHSYDHHRDPERKVLELILTAPMVVANWINMQYYASTVDPRAYGSGNKVIHNVVGLFGILEGNGGDLKTGLPWQSVHDGERFQHEPLRLTVVVDAPREAIEGVIRKHAIVHDLATNGWLTLLAWEGEEMFRWTANESWHAEGASLVNPSLAGSISS